MKKKLNLHLLKVKSFSTSKRRLTGGSRYLPTDAETCTEPETQASCASQDPYADCMACDL